MEGALPRPAATNGSAEWLASRIDLWSEHWVTGTAGTGFDAYCRIFHPLDDGPDANTWGDVAVRHSRTMHASAQWRRVSSPVGSDNSLNSGRTYPGDPMVGALRPAALAALCEILARYTRTPDDCYFALWEGWGWQHTGAHAVIHASPGSRQTANPEQIPKRRQLILSGPKFSLSGRTYLLFGGAIDSATRIGHWANPSWFIPQSPSILWPADHAWCVATEVDNDSTLVGGSRALTTAISSSPLLEAWPIAADASSEDAINSNPTMAQRGQENRRN